MLSIALILLFALTASVYAVDPTTITPPPTFIEATPQNVAIPTTMTGPGAGVSGYYGASYWSYQDKRDTTFKTEGSYKAFDDQTGIGKYTANPHGGYDTSTNKCKVIHAVHRSTGAYNLLRVDVADEACSYCHIGDHRHATSRAYWRAGTIYATNGQTIGSGKEIPDSSVL